MSAKGIHYTIKKRKGAH